MQHKNSTTASQAQEGQNRAERRRQLKSLSHQHRAWIARMIRFHRAGRGAFETYVVRFTEIAALGSAALAGDEIADRLLDAVARWSAEAEDARFHCLTCDACFAPGGGHPAEAWAVSVPFGNWRVPIIVAFCGKLLRAAPGFACPAA